LTFSIPFQIHDQGSGEIVSSFTAVSLQFICGNDILLCGSPGSSAAFSRDNQLVAFNETKTGILSFSVPLTQGQTGNLDFDTRVIATVPIPDMLWLNLVGLVGIILWERKRRHSLLA
jgi:hypothetical protein